MFTHIADLRLCALMSEPLCPAHFYLGPYVLRTFVCALMSGFVFFPILKTLFVELEWLKILNDPFEEDSPIVAPEISHILVTYFDFIFLLYFLKISCV